MAMVVAREWREIPGKYNLEGSRCACCGKIFFPSRSFCPVCRRAGIGKMEAHRLAGRGEVYSFTIIHENTGFNGRDTPYAVAMVLDDDGVMIEAQLANVDLGRIEIGMRVRAVLRKLDEDGRAGTIHYGYKFVPE